VLKAFDQVSGRGPVSAEQGQDDKAIGDWFCYFGAALEVLPVDLPIDLEEEFIVKIWVYQRTLLDYQLLEQLLDGHLELI